jgi:hypothetical protein
MQILTSYTEPRHSNSLYSVYIESCGVRLFLHAGSTQSAPKSERYSESALNETLFILSRHSMRPLLLTPSQRRMILAYTESTKSDKTDEYLTDLKKVEDIGDSQYWSQLRLGNVKKMGTTKLKQLYLLETALTAHKRLFLSGAYCGMAERIV